MLQSLGRDSTDNSDSLSVFHDQLLVMEIDWNFLEVLPLRD